MNLEAVRTEGGPRRSQRAANSQQGQLQRPTALTGLPSGSSTSEPANGTARSNDSTQSADPFASLVPPQGRIYDNPEHAAMLRRNARPINSSAAAPSTSATSTEAANNAARDRFFVRFGPATDLESDEDISRLISSTENIDEEAERRRRAELRQILDESMAFAELNGTSLGDNLGEQFAARDRLIDHILAEERTRRSADTHRPIGSETQ